MVWASGAAIWATPGAVIWATSGAVIWAAIRAVNYGTPPLHVIPYNTEIPYTPYPTVLFRTLQHLHQCHGIGVMMMMAVVVISKALSGSAPLNVHSVCFLGMACSSAISVLRFKWFRAGVVGPAGLRHAEFKSLPEKVETYTSGLAKAVQGYEVGV